MRHALTRSASIAALLAAVVAQSAKAGNDVTITGATLFESFFSVGASTNDFIDANNNGIFGFNGTGSPQFVENLAPSIGAGNIDASGNVTIPNTGVVSSGVLRTDYMTVKYRSTGSVEGIAELLSFKGTGTPNFQSISTGRINGFQVVTNNAASGPWAINGPSKFPAGMITNPPTINAYTNVIDIATSDVTTLWAAQGPAGAAKWNAKPTQAGYGQNTATSSTGYTNQLITLTSNPTGHTGIPFNTNTASPDDKTLYNTPVAVVPINVIANPGIGTDSIKSTDLQHLYVTGRTSTGENLAAVTRSIGSGTRNASMNSLGIDPSMAVGDNIGTDSALNPNKQLGAGYQTSNMTGSGDMETNVRNNRLAIGYTGSDRTVTRGLGLWGNMQVMFDHLGGTSFVTPNAASIVSNGDVNTGWRIYGNETFITLGDPNATAVNASYPSNGNLNATMSNSTAASYIRNITESIAQYTGDASSTASFFMPASQLANNFILRAAPDFLQNATDATFYSANTGQVADVKNKALASSGFTGPLVSTQGNGAVPQRVSFAGGYSDGSTTGAYLAPASATGGSFTVVSSMTINDRNKVAGDFNGDGARNVSDIPKIMEAIANPRAFSFNNVGTGSTGTTGMAADYAIPELLGDFNGDGNFNAKDVRYFADGLAISSGKLDRKAGFIAVDVNSSSNFFGTTVATSTTGKVYQPGDSRADIAGTAAITLGAQPAGNDGIIDVKDINYAWKQARMAKGSGTDGSWATLLTRAAADSNVDVRADLSADINGDLVLDASDGIEIVQSVLGTSVADWDLSRIVDAGDFDIWFTHVGFSDAGFDSGDSNGDGIIDAADFDNWFKNVGFTAVGNPIIGGGAAAVPEPTSLALIALATPLLLKPRKRNA